MLKKEICTYNRQSELDIARGFAVIFMVLIHTAQEFCDWQNVVFDKIVNFLGSPPAAPVFMFILGCGIVYTRHGDTKSLLRRGLHMLGLSYLFNALVYFLPYAISSLIKSDPEILAENLMWLYCTDILQFAGIVFIFFALVRKLNMKSWQVLICAAVLAGVGTVLTFLIPEVESPVARWLTGLFWNTHEGSYFPFSSWILYPAVGYCFAKLLERTTDKKKLYLTVSPIGGAIFFLMVFIMLNFHEWDALMDGPAYYGQSVFVNLMYIGFVFFWLGICYAIYAVVPRPVMKVFNTLSTNVTAIYVWQYVLIIYIEVIAFGDEASLGVWGTLLLFLIFTVLSYFGAVAHKKIKNKIKSTKI